MSSNSIRTSPLRQLWYRWKALRLPWRKRYLVGLDLNGNTFWEFHTSLPAHESSPAGGSRMRRIIEYPSGSKLHYSDATSQISPAWHQWLRHVRVEAPSLAEQSQDLIRQEQLRVLAKRADERWAAKRRVGDAPTQSGGELSQPIPGLGQVDVEASGTKGQKSTVQKTNVGGEEQQESSPDVQKEMGRQPHTPRGDPWARSRGTPGEEWQPQAWDPNSSVAKR